MPTRRARGADPERAQQLRDFPAAPSEERDIEAEPRGDGEPWVRNPLVLEVEAELVHPEVRTSPGRDGRPWKESLIDDGQTLFQRVQALENPGSGITHDPARVVNVDQLVMRAQGEMVGPGRELEIVGQLPDRLEIVLPASALFTGKDLACVHLHHNFGKGADRVAPVSVLPVGEEKLVAPAGAEPGRPIESRGVRDPRIVRPVRRESEPAVFVLAGEPGTFVAITVRNLQPAIDCELGGYLGENGSSRHAAGAGFERPWVHAVGVPQDLLETDCRRVSDSHPGRIRTAGGVPAWAGGRWGKTCRRPPAFRKNASRSCTIGPPSVRPYS